MSARLATVEEAEQLWKIRNQALREGCKDVYSADALLAWTPDLMPEGYRGVVLTNPFFVVDDESGSFPVATGFLDLAENSIEALFTLPEYCGKGFATEIIAAIKREAIKRGIRQLKLSSTPNAFTFYQRQGFTLVKETVYHSASAGALPCMEMAINLPEQPE
ncbi:GNAT family N-acetyltransferase [Erwinia sp.]|uniref:GNAT family N-acetyltransferase n=1 Tax=Erwinia citreus TaxID=558 RepID=UPI003C712B6F